MSHKLHAPMFRNDGENSVAHQNNQPSAVRVASNDAATSPVHAHADVHPEIPSTGNPQQVTGRRGTDDSSVLADSISTVEWRGDQRSSPEHPAASLACAQRSNEARCEVARSAGHDPTGENAFPCGAIADVLCEYCGPMCASCAEETFCYYGEHKLTQLPDDGPIPQSARRRGKLHEVVYAELKCPKCLSVRLALPKNHRTQPIRKCPVCRSKARVQYLAHGFTRRRLPYHEVFTLEKELPEGAVEKRRIPWDSRPRWWQEEE